MSTEANRCGMTRIMWSSSQTQPFCPVAGPPRRRWARLGPDYLQLVFLQGSLWNVRAKMPDPVGLGGTNASTSQPQQPLSGDWLDTWRLGAPYQLQQLFHLSSCFNQEKQMSCAMQEEESISCSFHLLSCLRRAILWNARSSSAVAVINRDGDRAGKRITEAQIECDAPWGWRVAQAAPWVSLAVWWKHCLPVWAHVGSVRSWCHWCLALSRRAGCCSQVLSRLWGLRAKVMVLCWHFQGATRMDSVVWLSLCTWSYHVRVDSELNSFRFWL